MRDEILTYLEMCQRERMSLQRGMNFREPPSVSVVLMSRRPGAPYDDQMSADGQELTYEGHDLARSPSVDPKTVDQPRNLPSGAPTENGKFAAACEQGGALVRAYEKLRPGIWSDKGLFELRRYEHVLSGGRKVFKFHMCISDAPDERLGERMIADSSTFRRAIPGWVKQEVFKRDKGRCVLCGAQDQLHFDHDFPYSKGGTGLTPHNVRILCARHNLQKGARIE